jgi:hypothetical protein
MLDKLNLEIEQRAYEEGSYVKAIISFCEEKHILDFEDVTEALHPILIQKVKAEYRNGNYFREGKSISKLDSFFN